MPNRRQIRQLEATNSSIVSRRMHIRFELDDDVVDHLFKDISVGDDASENDTRSENGADSGDGGVEQS
jgi:hypothetical protein